MRPFQVVAVTSSRGVVGNTKLAGDLAIYLRLLREDLPILVLGLGDELALDATFALDDEPPKETVATGLRAGSFASAIRKGQYGVHYVPSSPDIGELEREIEEPFVLDRLLSATDWRGLVIVEAKGDLKTLAQNAIAASDLVIVVVTGEACLAHGARVFGLPASWTWPRDAARIALWLADLRVEYQDNPKPDILTALASRIRSRAYPVFLSFAVSAPNPQAPHTSAEELESILHGVPIRVDHRPLHNVAANLLGVLDTVGRRAGGAPRLCLLRRPAAAGPLPPGVPASGDALSAEGPPSRPEDESVSGGGDAPEPPRARPRPEVAPFRGRLVRLDRPADHERDGGRARSAADSGCDAALASLDLGSPSAAATKSSETPMATSGGS